MNGLAKITIDGQEVVLKFGMPAIRQIAEKTLLYPLLDGDRYNDLGLAHILYAGYINGCLMHDQLPLVTFDKFYDLLENAPENESVLAEINTAVRSFEQSKYVAAAVEKQKSKEEEEKKRQAAGMK